MKENEFDIYVRDLMEGAEESVSPKVWKGVEAGLGRAARRVVPAWLWSGLAATGIAAAAAAAFILLPHRENISNQPTITNPVAEATAEEPLPAETTPEEVAVTTIDEQAARLRSRIAEVREPVLPAVVEEPAEAAAEPSAEESRPTLRPDAVTAPSAPQRETVEPEDDPFRQLAFEEHRTRRKGQLSMSVIGTVQSNTRQQSQGRTIRRSSPLLIAPKPAKTGLYDERPELNFGLPFSAGVSFRYDFSPRWGIGTGILYTNLSRSFIASYAEVGADGALVKDITDTDVVNQQHYLGVPVTVFFNIVNNGNWNFHARLDGMGEKLLDNRFLIHDSAGDLHLHRKADGFQLSAGVGLGVEFKFSPHIGIYFDPTVRYYFDCGQPRSLRTIQPLRMDFEAGLRFSLGQ